MNILSYNTILVYSVVDKAGDETHRQHIIDEAAGEMLKCIV